MENTQIELQFYERALYDTCRQHYPGSEEVAVKGFQDRQGLRACFEKYTTAFNLTKQYFSEARENRAIGDN